MFFILLFWILFVVFFNFFAACIFVLNKFLINIYLILYYLKFSLSILYSKHTYFFRGSLIYFAILLINGDLTGTLSFLGLFLSLLSFAMFHIFCCEFKLMYPFLSKVIYVTFTVNIFLCFQKIFFYSYSYEIFTLGQI